MLLTVAVITCAVLIVLIGCLSVLQWALQRRRADQEYRELSTAQRDCNARRYADNPLLLETLQQDIFTRDADLPRHTERWWRPGQDTDRPGVRRERTNPTNVNRKG